MELPGSRLLMPPSLPETPLLQQRHGQCDGLQFDSWLMVVGANSVLGILMLPFLYESEERENSQMDWKQKVLS